MTASSRPQAGSNTARRRTLRRGLLAVPVTLSLMAPAGAHAEATNGYTQTPPPPTTATKSHTTSSAPAKEAAPSKSTSPSVDLGTPVAVKPSAPPSTLPFTGLDLRWVIAGGVLLLGFGFTLRFLNRRTRSS